MSNIVADARKRYATKAFEAGHTLSDNARTSIKELLQLAPSSVNAQPWTFIIAETDAGKARVAKATDGKFAYNKAKVLNACQVVVFCTRTELDSRYLEKLTDAEGAAGRFKDDAAKKEQNDKRKMYVDMHKELGDLAVWTTKQTYLNLGAFLLGVSALGLDAVPMEGFDVSVIDQEFGLKEKAMTGTVLVAVGFKAKDDFNAALPKARLPLNEILTEI